jgi:hypothetical protein
MLDHNSWCFKFKKELSVVPGRWSMIHDDEESGRQVAGWLAGSRNDDDADDNFQQLPTFVVRPSLQ